MKQGILVILLLLTWQSNAASPIDEFKSPYELESQISALLRNGPDFRLPTTCRPSHYEVYIEPFFDTNDATAFTFEGSVQITLQPQQAGLSQIVLHSNDITIDSLTLATQAGVAVTLSPTPYTFDTTRDFLTISTAAALTLGTNYVLSITHRGRLQTDMFGFYRSWYYDADGTLRWMGTTQFQPGHARKAFPCFDEPGFKATFNLHITRPAGYSETISNMKLASIDFLSGGRRRDNFHTTPVMSTYLIAFIVSHYEATDITEPTAEKHFSTVSRRSAQENGNYAFTVGQDILSAMDNYTGIPYYSMASNMKMDQASIPDFTAGAMENWGILTYREALILYDDVHTSDFYKQRIANIIAHEVAHMWFGNLVTCSWWNVLWINEGFARYYQYYLTGWVETEMGFDERFISEQIHQALLADSIDSASPMSNPDIYDAASVWGHFSAISYAKGATILRMTEHFLGANTYHDGLRNYLQTRQYDVASPEHLFLSLQTQATADGAMSQYIGVTVQSYLTSWVDQAGYPLLTVDVNQTNGEMTITQSRFERNSGSSNFTQLWQIPVTFTRAGDVDFEDTKPLLVLSTATTIINKGSAVSEWVLFNKQQIGYYRVNYDEVTWNLILNLLTSPNRTIVHPHNRVQIVDDLFALGRAGILTYSRTFDLLRVLQLETAYGAWYSGTDGFNFLLRRLAHEPTALNLLKTYILQLLDTVVNTLGFDELANETFMEGLTRLYVAQLACNNGHQLCINTASRYYAALRAIPSVEVPANLRPWVYCTALRHGTAADYYYLWQRFWTTNVYNEKIVILGSLGCTSDADAIRHYLTQSISPDSRIRDQDRATAFNNALTGNEANSQVVQQWLSDNLAAAHPVYTTSGVNYLGLFANRLITEQQIQQFETFLTQNQAILGTSYSTGVSGATTARANLLWTAGRIGDIQSWLDTNIIATAVAA